VAGGRGCGRGKTGGGAVAGGVIRVVAIVVQADTRLSNKLMPAGGVGLPQDKESGARTAGAGHTTHHPLEMRAGRPRLLVFIHTSKYLRFYKVYLILRFRTSTPGGLIRCQDVPLSRRSWRGC
jgi:hypothetical protein